MERKYKTLGFCRMCKKKFEIKPSKSMFQSKSYCDDCCKKYFKKNKE